MTAPATEQPAPRITGEPGTRLEQLHAAYLQAKANADAAAAELRTITDALKSELSTAAPGHSRVDLVPPPDTDYPPLRLSYVESWRVDSRKLKSEDPESYVRYAKKTGAWVLKVVSS